HRRHRHGAARHRRAAERQEIRDLTMAISEYIISSRSWTTETLTIDGSPTDVTAAAGGLYLWHSTASLSLLARVAAAMAAAGVDDAAAYITDAGYVRLTSSGVFAITWRSEEHTSELQSREN